MRPWIEPISDQRAAFLTRELHRHRNRRRTGRCQVCQRPDCQGVRQALAELRMAGRETGDR